MEAQAGRYDTATNFPTTTTNEPCAAERDPGRGAAAAPQSRGLGTECIGKVSYRKIWTQDFVPPRLSFQGFLFLV